MEGTQLDAPSSEDEQNSRSSSHSSEDAPSSEDVQKSSSSGHSSAGNEEEKHTHLRFLFSKDDFASLMGQGGSPIRLIQSESGAGIQWSHDYEYLPGTGTADRIIEVSGAVQNIKKTVHLILDKLVGLELAPLALLSPVYHATGDYSKYLTEFEELECIGTGGFGVVASCVNKLDKKLYAVKKIPINYSQLSTQKLLRTWIESSLFGCLGDLEEDMRTEDIHGPCIYLLMEKCKGFDTWGELLADIKFIWY